VQIEIGIDPVFLEVGPFALTWHGLFSALAVAAGVWLARKGIRDYGISLPRFDEIAFITVAGGILGARLFYFFDRPRVLLDDPLEFFRFTEGGLAVWGAVIGGFFTLAIVSRFYGFGFARVADAVAPGLLLAQAIGRIGCIINGDAWGAETSWPLAFIYTHPDALLPERLHGVPTHPYPLYDIIIDLATLALIWRWRRAFPPGVLFALYALLYSIARFIISFVREEEVWFWGMQQAQVVSLVVALVSLVSILILCKRPNELDPPTPETEQPVAAPATG
jgi:phosphatidylglycerol:prolipoprotein diacylglycerol transferase